MINIESFAKYLVMRAATPPVDPRVLRGVAKEMKMSVKETEKAIAAMLKILKKNEKPT
jgi:hypothetical protein